MSAMAKNGRRGVYPTGGLEDRAGLAPRQIQLAIAVIGVGLQGCPTISPDGPADVRRADRANNRTSPPEVPLRRKARRRGHRPSSGRLSVLHMASTGTTVSSPCSRWAARTLRLDQDAAADRAPCRSSRRRRHGRQGNRRAFERIALGLTVQRLMLAELFEGDHRQKARPRPAARDDMERRRGLRVLLAVRQVNFSRTVSTTFHWRGVVSSVRVTSSPSLRRRTPPQQAQAFGASITTRRAADRRGRCCAPLACARSRRPSSSSQRPAPRRVVFGGARLQLFEFPATTDRAAAPSAPTFAQRSCRCNLAIWSFCAAISAMSSDAWRARRRAALSARRFRREGLGFGVHEAK